MKLGFYYHIVLYRNSKGIMIPSFLGVFLDSLAPLVTKLIIFGHEGKDHEKQACDYCLKSENIDWINLGFKTPFWDRVLFPGKSLKGIKERISSCDSMLVRAPSPLAPYFYSKFGKQTKVCYLLVGDYIEELKTQKESFHRKIPITLLTYLNEFLQNRAIKKCTTLVNSRRLFDKYSGYAKDLHEVRTTTISKADFYERSDSFDPTDKEINLLFTGRISITKGVLDVIVLASHLVKEGRKVKVHFVGWEDNPDRPVEKQITKLATELCIQDNILFHGKKSVGNELFSFYRMAQVYVLPTQTHSEGFPRTLWEAMANSLPIVTTKVGSIPYFIDNERHALLVEPCDTDELLAAVKRIITDGKIRKSLIANAFDLAKDVTLERQSEHLVKIIKSRLNE